MLDVNDLQLDEFAEYLTKKSMCKDGHAKYTHVVKTMRNRAKSPLDLL